MKLIEYYMKLIENYLKLKLIYFYTTVHQVYPTGKNASTGTGRWVDDCGSYPYPLRSYKYRLLGISAHPCYNNIF